MTAITFDTLQFVKDLQTKGFQPEQAEGISDALKNVLVMTEVATKADITELKHDIQEMRLEFKAEVAPLRWGIGICAAGIISLVAKSFF
jgi:hypothetical protein